MGKKVVSISVFVYFKGKPIDATEVKLMSALSTNNPLFCHLFTINKAQSVSTIDIMK